MTLHCHARWNEDLKNRDIGRLATCEKRKKRTQEEIARNMKNIDERWEKWVFDHFVQKNCAFFALEDIFWLS